MKKYQSHKIVEAAQIVAAEFSADGSGKVVVKDDAGVNTITIDVPPGFKRPNTDPSMNPEAGDYLVRYQPDGYLSWSPKAVFEAGYREIGDTGLAPAALSAVLGPTPAAVEVTVTAPAGKRAEVGHGAGEVQSMFTVTERQSQTWSVMKGERLAVRAGDVLEVAHKRDAS